MAKNKFFEAIAKGEKNNPPEPMLPGNRKARFENPPMKGHGDTSVKKTKVKP